MSEVRVIKKNDYASRLDKAIGEIKILFNVISGENTRLQNALDSEATPKIPRPLDVAESKSDIAAKITQWAINGDLVLRINMGARSVIANKVKRGELFQTSFGAILATNEDVRNQFEAYIDNGCLMDANKLAVKYDLTTRFAINKACKRGTIDRIDCFGKAVALFVV